MELSVCRDQCLVPINIEQVEQRYNATYVMDTSIRGSDGQWFGPVALFYASTKHAVSGSHYFAIYVSFDRTLVISNGQSAVDHVYTGLVYNNKIYISRFRHDFRQVGPNVIDGGLDYTRRVGLALPTVSFIISDGKVVVQP